MSRAIGVESLFIGTPVYNSGGTMVSVLVLQLTHLSSNLMDSRTAWADRRILSHPLVQRPAVRIQNNMLSMGSGNYVVGYQLERPPQYWKIATGANFDGGHSQQKTATARRSW